MKENKNAMSIYNSDQKKKNILNLLESKGGKNSAELAKELNLKPNVCKNTLMRMFDERLVTREKYLCEISKRYVWKFFSSNTKFVARTYDQCLQKLKDMHSYDYQPKGKYDDLIDKNPNRRVYAGKTSLFETKNNDYFLNGQQDKVNRGIGSTWSLYDVA
jgi:predicted transcriptional regulator